MSGVIIPNIYSIVFQKKSQAAAAACANSIWLKNIKLLEWLAVDPWVFS